MNQRNYDLMCSMTVQSIIDSKDFSLEEKDEFFEEVQLTLSEEYDRMQEAEEDIDYYTNDDYE